jgi:hypothetical protein
MFMHGVSWDGTGRTCQDFEVNFAEIPSEVELPDDFSSSSSFINNQTKPNKITFTITKTSTTTALSTTLGFSAFPETNMTFWWLQLSRHARSNAAQDELRDLYPFQSLVSRRSVGKNDVGMKRAKHSDPAPLRNFGPTATECLVEGSPEAVSHWRFGSWTASIPGCKI